MAARSEMEELRAFCEGLADASGRLIREASRGALAGDAKGDGSPVTAIDRAVEDRLREMIAEAYPDHGIVGEERGASATEREFVWVLDPIDGTLPFLAGIPVYGTLIALLRDRAPLLGVIDMPATGERWIGCAGLPTTRNGAPVRARACQSLSNALLSTSNPDFYGEADWRVFRRLAAETHWSVYGGSCMAYAQIASGRIDVGIDVAFEPFDYLALVPVVAGAGGVVSDWAGEPLSLDSGDRFIAAGDARVHAQALEILSRA
ncbi:MAG: inositol monophosphatase family protein [Kiloniellales bacterium]|nr:inositol monophosphatase family protein [Kiloniellales bacterium]